MLQDFLFKNKFCKKKKVWSFKKNKMKKVQIIQFIIQLQIVEYKMDLNGNWIYTFLNRSILNGIAQCFYSWLNSMKYLYYRTEYKRITVAEVQALASS